MSEGSTPHPHARVVGHELPVWEDRADFDIDVRIPEDEDGLLERLSVRRVTDDLYEVCCLPFFLYDVCLGDTIRVAGLSRTTPGTVTGRVEDAGRFVFRLILQPSRTTMQGAASSLVSMGFLVESHGSSYLAVDAPDEEQAAFLAAYLQTGEDAGDWEYETGRR